jgi:hypothetical protein
MIEHVSMSEDEEQAEYDGEDNEDLEYLLPPKGCIFALQGSL